MNELTAQTTRAFWASTVWLQALWPTLKRRGGWFAAALAGKMCPGSD